MTLDPAQVGDRGLAQSAPCHRREHRMAHPASTAVDAAFDETGVGHPRDHAGARRRADQQSPRQLSHRRLAAGVVELDQHVVPVERQPVSLDELAVETASQRQVGPRKPSQAASPPGSGGRVAATRPGYGSSRSGPVVGCRVRPARRRRLGGPGRARPFACGGWRMPNRAAVIAATATSVQPRR